MQMSNNTAFQSKKDHQQMGVLCLSDLDLDPMTLILDLDLDLLKTYLCTKNKVSM